LEQTVNWHREHADWVEAVRGANIAPIMQTTLPETAPQVEESEIKEP
jgi:hypothetical protein